MKTTSVKRYGCAVGAVLALVVTGQASAAVWSWDGSDGNWDTDASWSGGVEPTAADQANINAGTVAVTMTGETAQVIQVNGALNVDPGGDLTTTQSGVVGSSVGTSGQVSITGPGATWTNSGFVIVGEQGTGTLNIQAGGAVTNTSGNLGDQGTGTATVTGAGSTWTNSSSLSVGNQGDGTLNVEAGGAVTNTFGDIGRQTGATGTATVTGAGSTWTNTSNLSVGRFGDGTLNIQAGGTVSNDFGFIGFGGGSTGTATVTGAGSTWNNSGRLEVGRDGTGTLVVESGGHVSANSARVGDGAAGETGQVFLLSNGGTLDVSTSLSVGHNGQGSLEAGVGTVSSNSASIGTFPGSNGFVSIGRPLLGADPATWTNTVDLHVGGSAAGPGGTGFLNLNKNADVTVGGTLTVWGAGQVTSGGSLRAATIDHTNGGQFGVGSGRLSVDSFLGTLEQFGGTLTPGGSSGSTSVSADYDLNAGFIEIELAGLIAGTEHDKLSVTGALNLGGAASLEVLLIDGFVPGAGDSFDILNWGSITGGFHTVNLPTLGANLDWDTSNLLVDGTLVVVSTLIGDLNGDGFVGIADLNIVLGAWNQNVPPGDPLADPSGDGFVGIEDLNTVLGNWNAGTPPASGANIPEPASLALLCITGLLWWPRRNRLGTPR